MGAHGFKIPALRTQTGRSISGRSRSAWSAQQGLASWGYIERSLKGGGRKGTRKLEDRTDRMLTPYVPSGKCLALNSSLLSP